MNRVQQRTMSGTTITPITAMRLQRRMWPINRVLTKALLQRGQCTGMLVSLVTAAHTRTTAAPTPAGDAPCAAQAAAQPERPQWARLA